MTTNPTRRGILSTGIAAVAALACRPLIAAEPAPAKPKPLRILLLTGRNNHDWAATTPVLERVYKDSGRFTVDTTKDPSKMTAELLAGYDVIVSNWCAFPKVEERSWGETAEKAFLDFVRGGRGVVFFHAATATFTNWPEFQQLAGGTWGKNTSHGPNGEKIRVTAVVRDHPITQDMPDFLAADELWRTVPWHSAAQVLCRAKPTAAGGPPVAPDGEPVAVATRLGDGRGFYLVLGHDVRAMDNPAWRTLMLRGAEWAATAKVSIPFPTDWPTAP